jgi:hypothetical protein
MDAKVPHALISTGSLSDAGSGWIVQFFLPGQYRYATSRLPNIFATLQAATEAARAAIKDPRYAGFGYVINEIERIWPVLEPD